MQQTASAPTLPYAHIVQLRVIVGVYNCTEYAHTQAMHDNA